MIKIESPLIISEEDLPVTARSLGKEALSLALDLIGEISPDAFETEFKEFLNAFIEHAILLPNELITKIPEYASDLQAFLTDVPALIELADQLNISDESGTEYSRLMNSKTEQQQNRLLAGIILWLIQYWRLKENRLLSENYDYSTLAEQMDDYSIGMHEMCFYIRTIPSMVDTVLHNAKRSEIASMAGRAKNAPIDALKKQILWRASKFSTEKTATFMARTLYDQLEDNWKSMADKLLIDPKSGFTRWIRDSRVNARRKKTLTSA